MKRNKYLNFKSLIPDIFFVAAGAPFIVTSTLAFIYQTNKQPYDTFFTPIAFLRAFANFIDRGHLAITALFIIGIIFISTFIKYRIDKNYIANSNQFEINANIIHHYSFLETLMVEIQTYFIIALSLSVGIIGARVIVFVWHPLIVIGDSMNPTYTNGEILITTTSFDMDDISVGDVVAFKSKNIHDGKESLIKRVVGVPGDSLYIRDGVLYVNGENIEELQYDSIVYLGCLKEETILKDYEFFCMGDNRNYSTDCRFIGPIQFDDIENLILRKIIK